MEISGKKTGMLTAIAAVFVLVIGACVYQTLDHTPVNPAEASGNTAGNLYNGGYFCEYEGDVYYSNIADEYNLYCMHQDGTITKEDAETVFSLNIYNGYLYYSKNASKAGSRNYFSGMPYGIYRMKLQSGSTKCLTTVLSPYIALCGNTILFQEYSDTSLYFSRVQINKEGGTTRISDVGYQVACSYNGFLYYPEQGSHTIYRYNPVTDASIPVYEGNCYQPVCIDGMMYFIDLEDDYKLKKVSLTEGEPVVVSNEHCVNYNTDGTTVYYEVENSASGAFGLYRCDADGQNVEQISDQSCKMINMTSDYTYFTYTMNDAIWYRVRTTGDTVIERFQEIIN